MQRAFRSEIILIWVADGLGQLNLSMSSSTTSPPLVEYIMGLIMKVLDSLFGAAVMLILSVTSGRLAPIMARPTTYNWS